ncbi:DUF2334 domain-containing protein [Clostridium sp. WLY-B-L2]|jgi:hypothetical protein|uniref:DUF2334 domain-containing protein n=1 Tax=Clostridium aromativorans TaxID=2836848 RepID=A0ABS8N572_9CLOT|nr:MULTISPECIES: DUF2334 domain-containing protein [Clostridium]KAA8665193.1 DUF2334 domain-containing protein [Clostridium sp. HV4-5-A1G]MCC9294811.1 DUF2334 domain-containing protein [Clostridium aromativorans]
MFIKKAKYKFKLILLAGIVIVISGAFILGNKKLPKQNDASKILEQSNRKFSSFKGLDMKEEDIRLNFKMKPLSLQLPIYNDNNRLYIPVSEICNTELTKDNAVVKMNDKSVRINLLKNSYYEGNKEYNLRKKAIASEDVLYLSLFDFTKLFNLKTDWDVETKTLSLFYNSDILLQKIEKKHGRPALIRLEDITAGQRYATSESLEKLRIIADYLYHENVPFHVAWIPRYMNPPKGIDNDPSTQLSMYNTDFVFTLDYLIDKNGIVGLHGYTHQQGEEESVDGIEFNSKINAGEECVRRRVNLAINCAKKLDIPVYFFESPHYDATRSQKRIMGEYFNYIYEAYRSQNEKAISKVKIQNRVVSFIPTPLDCVNGAKCIDNMIDRIYTLPKKTLASFFYHPNIEFEYIKITKDKSGYTTYTYSEESPLHQLLRVFSDKNYEFKSIKDLDTSI